jgi:hypothetical protein
MPDTTLLNRAAGCYASAGSVRDAARCYRAAGAFRRAAASWEQAGALAEAAADYQAAGMIAEAAWILVHELSDTAAARSVLAGALEPGAPGAARTQTDQLEALNRSLAGVRCDVAEGLPPDAALRVLDDVTACLEGRDYFWGLPELERWAVGLAQAMTRPDLVAQIFAAAVRGGQPGAAQRWAAWSREVLHVPLRLPEPEEDPAGRRPRDA